MKLIIGFSRPKSSFVPFAKAIMWYQKTDYSHAFVRFNIQDLERDIVFQASSSMVNFWGGSFFDAKEISVAEYEVEITDPEWKALNQYFIDTAGKPYSALQIIGILIYKQTGKKFFRNGDEAFVCSELVARIIKDLKVIEVDMDIDYVMPIDVRELLDNNPAIFKKIK